MLQDETVPLFALPSGSLGRFSLADIPEPHEDRGFLAVYGGGGDDLNINGSTIKTPEPLFDCRHNILRRFGHGPDPLPDNRVRYRIHEIHNCCFGQAFRSRAAGSLAKTTCPSRWMIAASNDCSRSFRNRTSLSCSNCWPATSSS